MLHLMPVSDGLCDDTVASKSGYYKVEGSKNLNYFYWFFESRSDPTNDPVIIWLTGGPGCSSILALFAENGPCSVNADGTGTINNPYSWNSNANIMWVDQPAGTLTYDCARISGAKWSIEPMIHHSNDILPQASGFRTVIRAITTAMRRKWQTTCTTFCR